MDPDFIPSPGETIPGSTPEFPGKPHDSKDDLLSQEWREIQNPFPPDPFADGSFSEGGYSPQSDSLSQSEGQDDPSSQPEHLSKIPPGVDLIPSERLEKITKVATLSGQVWDLEFQNDLKKKHALKKRLEEAKEIARQTPRPLHNYLKRKLAPKGFENDFSEPRNGRGEGVRGDARDLLELPFLSRTKKSPVVETGLQSGTSSSNPGKSPSPCPTRANPWWQIDPSEIFPSGNLHPALVVNPMDIDPTNYPPRDLVDSPSNEDGKTFEPSGSENSLNDDGIPEFLVADSTTGNSLVSSLEPNPLEWLPSLESCNSLKGPTCEEEWARSISFSHPGEGILPTPFSQESGFKEEFDPQPFQPVPKSGTTGHAPVSRAFQDLPAIEPFPAEKEIPSTPPAKESPKEPAHHLTLESPVIREILQKWAILMHVQSAAASTTRSPQILTPMPFEPAFQNAISTPDQRGQNPIPQSPPGKTESFHQSDLHPSKKRARKAAPADRVPPTPSNKPIQAPVHPAAIPENVPSLSSPIAFPDSPPPGDFEISPEIQHGHPVPPPDGVQGPFSRKPPLKGANRTNPPQGKRKKKKTPDGPTDGESKCPLESQSRDLRNPERDGENPFPTNQLRENDDPSGQELVYVPGTQYVFESVLDANPEGGIYLIPGNGFSLDLDL